MRAPALRSSVYCWRIASEVLVAAIQAVAPIEQAAMASDMASSRTSRLCRLHHRLRLASWAAWALCRRTGAAVLRVAVGQLVTDAVDGEQPGRLPRVVLDLATDVHHMRVDGPFGDVVGGAVDLLEQLTPGEHPTRAAHHGQQQVELDRGHLHLDPAQGHLVAFGRHDQVTAAGGRPRGVGAGPAAAQYRPNPGHQLA